MPSIFTLIAACLTAFAAGAYAGNAPAQTNAADIARRVDHRYNHLRTLKAGFIESYRGAGMERTESGTLLLKKPAKMRWDYRQPREKLFISDGKLAYFYVPGEPQAREVEVKKLDDLRSPLRFLLGKSRLDRELKDLHIEDAARAHNPGAILLRGTPASMNERISSVLLEISPKDEILRIVIEELDGATTSFQFQDLAENIPLEDRVFSFSPPPGVRITRTSELAP